MILPYRRETWINYLSMLAKPDYMIYQQLIPSETLYLWMIGWDQS